ncbi:hypothetical protein [Tissierella praeacuta]|uniref:hypothetical protein n=1 Tax=Tissierella praeacuta TaxID=43131 RepID=UPI0028A5BE38|nr:hypothetical protein [Tissierella praeacuta]
MRKAKPRIIRPISLPNCPACGCKNTVGQVESIKEKVSKKGYAYYNCSKAYFCSNCLTEWDDEVVKKPLYA